MIAGTYIFTDTINRSFTEVFAQANTGTDVAVAPKKVDDDFFSDPPPLDDGLVARVRAADGVKSAAGRVFGDVSIRKRDGDPVGNWQLRLVAAARAVRAVPLRRPGARRASRTEIGLDQDTYEEQGFKLGEPRHDRRRRGRAPLHAHGRREVRRRSIGGGATRRDRDAARPRRRSPAARASSTGSPWPATDGVTPAQLRSRLQIALAGEPVTVRTGDDDAKAQAADLEDEFGFFRTALLVFGGIALFVGAFVIYNTFSITVAQRTRELALLRMLGATRRQVLRSVVLEAAVIGLIASLLGLLGGLAARPRAARRCSARSAPTCRPRTPSSRRARSSSRCSSASS